MNDQRWLRELLALPVSAIADARDGRGIFPQAIRAQGGDWTMAGPAYTVELPPGDNLGVHHAISKAPPGSVVVALCRGGEEYGIWGEITSAAAKIAGLAGFVTNGFVRDSRAIGSVGLPVFATGVYIRRTVKRDPGRHQCLIEFGDCRITPGDYIVGTSDGVVVVPAPQAETVVERARGIVQRELDILEDLKRGYSTLDLLGLEGPRTSTST
jgi:4-hydroxy-4-methyl-2-oxoglutarate aldolase